MNYKRVVIQDQKFILEKVKVVLDLSNYATKKELDHATSVETSDLAAKKFYCLNKLKRFKNKFRWYRC